MALTAYSIYLASDALILLISVFKSSKFFTIILSSSSFDLVSMIALIKSCKFLVGCYSLSIY